METTIQQLKREAIYIIEKVGSKVSAMQSKLRIDKYMKWLGKRQAPITYWVEFEE